MPASLGDDQSRSRIIPPPPRADEQRNLQAAPVRTRAGWTARHRGAGRARLPWRAVARPGRLSRGRGLLRPERLPDHIAAARRVAVHGARRPGALLASARSTSATGVAGAAGGDPDHYRAVPAGPARQTARRSARCAPVRGQLAAHLPTHLLLRGGWSTAAPAARVVTGHRRAVLSGVASAAGAGPALLQANAPDGAGACGCHAQQSADGAAVPTRR